MWHRDGSDLSPRFDVLERTSHCSKLLCLDFIFRFLFRVDSVVVEHVAVLLFCVACVCFVVYCV